MGAYGPIIKTLRNERSHIQAELCQVPSFPKKSLKNKFICNCVKESVVSEMNLPFQTIIGCSRIKIFIYFPKFRRGCRGMFRRGCRIRHNYLILIMPTLAHPSDPPSDPASEHAMSPIFSILRQNMDP